MSKEKTVEKKKADKAEPIVDKSSEKVDVASELKHQIERLEIEIKALREENIKLEHMAKSQMEKDLEKELNAYQSHSNLTNKEFIMFLKDQSVPPDYLVLLDDRDADYYMRQHDGKYINVGAMWQKFREIPTKELQERKKQILGR
jgi:TolA-binding protein